MVAVTGPAAECFDVPLRHSCSRGCLNPERVAGVVGGSHAAARSQLADQCSQPWSAQSDPGLEAEQWSLRPAGGCDQGVQRSDHTECAVPRRGDVDCGS